MKELVFDLRKHGGMHAPISINCVDVEIIESCFCVDITMDLLYVNHIDAIAKKAHQSLYFLSRLKKFSMSTMTLINFYRCIIGRMLFGLHHSLVCEQLCPTHKKLQRVVGVMQFMTQTKP